MTHFAIKLNSQKGFSLLEIMVAILIFAFISYAASQVLRNNQLQKIQVDEEIDTYHALRTSFRILHKDLSSIFNLNTIDFLPFGHVLPEDRPEAIKDPGAYQNYIQDQFPGLLYKSFFIGEENKIHFTSLSNFRVYADKHESEQAEISYTVEKDGADPKISHLYKRISPVIDDKFEEGGTTFLILEDLESIKFRYYDAATDQWDSSWDNNDEKHQGEIPDVIELALVLNSRNPFDETNVKKLSIKTSFRPMFLNSYRKQRLGGLEPLEKAMAPRTMNPNDPNADTTGGGMKTP